MKKSYWIYNQGDYEIYHTNLVNSRRQEFGVDYPVVWKVYGVEPKVDFHAEVYAEKDTTFVLHLEGKGYVFVDAWEKEFADGAMADVSKQDAPPDKRYRPGVSVPLSKGEHHLHICCLNLTGKIMLWPWIRPRQLKIPVCACYRKKQNTDMHGT